jgi:hypothetical protein
MTPIAFVTFVVIAFAIFMLGGVCAWVWTRSKDLDYSEKLSRRISISLSVFFALVALLVVADVSVLHVRTNAYIKETLPRDAAQEACNNATLKVLTQWAQARVRRDSAMNDRDDAAVAVLNRLMADEPIPPEEYEAWRDAVQADRKARAESEPLPAC